MLSCSAACGIFPDQGWKLCPLRWQVGSYPLYCQGSPINNFLIDFFIVVKYTTCNVKWTVLTVSKFQLSGIKYIHIVVQPLPLFICRTLSLSQTETLPYETITCHQ